MNKSIYSLVLMDNVVSEVDKMAYEMGTSRSNLINQILAEYVRYTTPEMRMRAVFEEMERLMQGVDSFQIQPQPSDAMLTIRSALRYKYKPTIRYSVELYRSSRGRTVGALKVAFRTQSQPLIEMLTSFFALWTRLEGHYREQLRAHVLKPLSEKFGIDTSDEALLKTIAEHNEVCRLIKEIGDYRKLDNPIITGYEFHVIQLVTLVCPKYLILPYLRETAEELRTRLHSAH